MDPNHIWRFANPWDYMRKVREGMPPLIICVAITGGAQGKETNPNLPETPEEQAKQTHEAYQAGACLVHVHARNPDSLGQMSCDPERYFEINRLIRQSCPDIIINNTAGGDFVDREPTGGKDGCCWACMDANPEIVAFDCGPLAYRVKLSKREPPLSGRPKDLLLDDVFQITFGELESKARIAQERRIKVEFEIFHSGQYWLMDHIVRQNLVAKPYWVQFVLGVQNGNYPTPMDLLHLVAELPDDALFSVIGVGPYQTPLTTMGILLGGHVRVGMEDNIYYKRGEKATSNAQFIERLARIAKELGREIATPAIARDMLGLSPTPSQYPEEKRPRKPTSVTA